MEKTRKMYMYDLWTDCKGSLVLTVSFQSRLDSAYSSLFAIVPCFLHKVRLLIWT